MCLKRPAPKREGRCIEYSLETRSAAGDSEQGWAGDWMQSTVRTVLYFDDDGGATAMYMQARLWGRSSKVRRTRPVSQEHPWLPTAVALSCCACSPLGLKTLDLLYPQLGLFPIRGNCIKDVGVGRKKQYYVMPK